MCVVTVQMVGDRRSPGRQYWGARSCTSSANHHSPVPPTGPVLSDESWTVHPDGFLSRWRILYLVAAFLFRPCRCGDFGFVSRHKPAEHRILDITATPDVEASIITSCRGRRVSFCRPHLLSVSLCSTFAGEILEEALPSGFLLCQCGSTTFVLQGQLLFVLHDFLHWPWASSLQLPWEKGVGSVLSC